MHAAFPDLNYENSTHLNIGDERHPFQRKGKKKILLFYESRGAGMLRYGKEFPGRLIGLGPLLSDLEHSGLQN